MPVGGRASSASAPGDRMPAVPIVPVAPKHQETRVPASGRANVSAPGYQQWACQCECGRMPVGPVDRWASRPEC